MSTGGLSGTGGTAGATGTGGSTSLDDEAALPTPVTTAGFIDLEAVNYSYVTGTDPSATHVNETSSPAKLFYSFIPAAVQSKSAPLFVLYNGGPATATTSILHAFGTGPTTLTDPAISKQPPQANANSWTALGNLLYIDTRQAGFSYATLANPSDAAARQSELDQRNFNTYIDAADVVRVMLRVLASMPALRNNPVVLVGESYGGTRAANMLRMLLDPNTIATAGSDYYADPTLAAEIRTHYAAVFPNEDATQVTGAKAARQFGWQLLLQPDIAYNLQYQVDRCSSAYALAQRIQELGLSCPPTGQDTYDWGQPSGWSDAASEWAREVVTTADGFAQLMGVAATSVSGLSAAERTGAYRVFVSSSAPTEPSQWLTTFGVIADYDRYFMTSNKEVSDFYSPLIIDPRTLLDGYFLLQNLRYVHTFITRALLDPVIVADAIPEVLNKYSQFTNPQALSSVTLDVAPRDGVARPGWITVTYTGAWPDTVAGDTRTIRFPTYRDSGHMVTVSSPTELFADVQQFVQQTMP